MMPRTEKEIEQKHRHFKLITTLFLRQRIKKELTLASRPDHLLFNRQQNVAGSMRHGVDLIHVSLVPLLSQLLEFLLSYQLGLTLTLYVLLVGLLVVFFGFLL